MTYAVSAVVCYVFTFLLFASALLTRKKGDTWRTFGAKVLAVISGCTHVYAWFSLVMVVADWPADSGVVMFMALLAFLGFWGLFLHWLVGIYDVVLSENLWAELHYVY